VLDVACLVAFTLTNNFYGLMVIRLLTGFFQVFQATYYSVWADKYGSSDKEKTMWMTVLIVCSPIGVLAGYILAATFIENTDWRWVFWT